jgi:putative PIN family toxin of toxin-antitoxin system
VYRVVIDVGVLVVGLISRRGAPRELLIHWLRGGFELLVSRNLLDELKRVLSRPKFRRYLTLVEANAFVQLLSTHALIFPDPEEAPRLAPDRGDDYLVALARSSGSHFLVSGDAHLTGASTLRPPILTPRAFLLRVQAQEQEGG